jgi:uncharacterized membrane protein
LFPEVNFWTPVSASDTLSVVMTLNEMAEYCALGIEVAAGAVIVAGLMFASARALLVGIRKKRWDQAYERLRQSTGRALLLGLELLVAADIIQTIVAPTNLQTIMVLGLTIAVRTFLSIALQVEIEGRWPWDASETDDEISV